MWAYYGSSIKRCRTVGPVRRLRIAGCGGSNAEGGVGEKVEIGLQNTVSWPIRTVFITVVFTGCECRANRRYCKLLRELPDGGTTRRENRYFSGKPLEV